MILRGFFTTVVLLPLFLCSHLNAQSLRTNYPIKQFSSYEYGGNPVNYEVKINEKGQVFFANIGRYSGLVMFNGKEWKNFPLKNKVPAKSLALGIADTVYIGGENEFGYFSYNQSGEYTYLSLSESLPDSLQNFDLVFFVHKSKQYTIFNALTRVFVFENNRFVKHFDAKRFGYSSVVDGDIWLKNIDTYYKLIKMNGEPTLSPISDLDLIANRYSFGAFPISDTSHVFALSGSAPIEYSSISKLLKPLEVSNIDQLSKDHVLSAGKLKNGRFYISSFSNGLYIYDANRTLIQHINKEDNSEYFSGTINAVSEDNFGNVWMALRKGVAVARPFSSVQKFWSGNKFEGTFNDIYEFKNHIYASTDKHIYQATLSEDTLPDFKQISDVSSSTTKIEEIDGDLFFASDFQGLNTLNVVTNKIETVLDQRINIQYIETVPQYKTLIGSAYNTIVLLRKENGKWIQKWASDKFPVKSFILKFEDKLSSEKELHFWVGTVNHGLYYFTVHADDMSIKQPFTKAESNIPQLHSGLVEPSKFFDEIIIQSNDSLYTFSQKSGKKFLFEPVKLATEQSEKNSSSPLYYFEESENETWVATNHSVKKISRTNNTMQTITYPELNALQIGVVQKIITDSKGSVWIAGFDGIALYKPDLKTNPISAPNAFVTVTSNDSVLFNSYRNDSQISPIPFSGNSLHFEFGSDWFHPDISPDFSWKMDGYNNKYSPWQNSESVTLSNLSPGNYTLHFKARDISRLESAASSISFIILEPWYASWWMWMIYIFLGFLAIFMLIQWRSYSLNQKRIILEEEVKQRTKEVVDQKQKIEELVKELQHIDALKSEYFANISHEFRTPLTLMLNPLEEILKTAEIDLPTEWKEKLIVVSRNTHRLKKLVDEILDLIKLESGILSLNNTQINLHYRTKLLVSSFSSFADSKGITLKFESNIPHNLYAELDDSKYEHIINNLISNALKFTPTQGKVSVTLSEFKEQILLKVEDTGIGISDNDLPNIFNRFYKTEQQDNRYEGLGIGLALSSQLSEFLGGSLSAKSELGKGTVFTLLLPLHEVDKPLETQSKSVDQEHLSRITNLNRNYEKSDFNEQILIIEDNEDMRNFVGSLLAKKYLVKTVENGVKGLKELKSNNISLVISDIMMPEMDGMSFAKQVRKQSRFHTTPIIFLSARADIGDQIKGLRLGVEDYLVKPFNNEELLVRVENLLENRRRIVATIESKGVDKNNSDETDSDQFLQKTKDLILDHLADPGFNVAQLAGDMFLSERQLSRKLKSLTGCTPAEYIKQVKLYQARMLLEQKKYATVGEIAAAVGYSKVDYFSRLFKSTFGRSPSTFM